MAGAPWEAYREQGPWTAYREPPGSLEDVARVIPGGLAKGVAAVAGIPGDVLNGANWLAGKIAGALPALPPELQAAKDKAEQLGVNANPGPAPGSAAINDAISAPFGGYYKPQTTAGKYAETIASFAPAALAPGGAAARIARVVVPGATSEAAGQAAAGTRMEPWARVAGGLAGGLGVAAAPSVGRTAARMANRASAAFGGPELLDPEREAARRLAAAVMRDGGAANVTRQLNDWAASGASNPSLLDVSGNNVRRLVRAAAGGPEGEAQNLATAYQDRITGNLQDNATTLARRLTPNDPRTAEQLAGDLEQEQRTAADTQYRQPYSQPASVTPEMVDALQGPEGRAAIGRAYIAARANRNTQQMGELKDLLGVAGEQSGGRDPLTGRVRSLADALSNVSAGALDRVRIAMRETGGALAQKGARDIARGYFGRVGDIDTALDQTPGLTGARANYRSFAQQRDAIPVGQSGINAPAETYAPQLQDMTPEARNAAGVGYRQAIVNAIQKPAEGTTGALNRLATSTQQGQNLETTFGPQAAQRFQTGVGNEISRVRNARVINPNTGSQTALRMDESSLIDAIPVHRLNFLATAIDMIKRGTTLTPTERAAIVRLGTTEANLRGLVQSLPQAQSQQIARQVLIAGQLGNGRRQQ